MFELFQLADTDQSGYIDRDEVAELAKKLGKKLGKKQLNKAMALVRSKTQNLELLPQRYCSPIEKVPTHVSGLHRWTPTGTER